MELIDNSLLIEKENSIAKMTYWKRVRYSTENPPWILKEIPGKGLAAFSQYNFKAGDLICTEFPVVWIHGHHPFSNHQIEEINEKINELNEEDKEAFYGMANVFSVEEHPPAVGVFMTNCFDMTDSIYGTTCAMYLALARLNHSCSPNVQQSHLPDTTEEVLYASRDIAIGDEINDCYIDLRQDRASRQKSLQEFYRFTCECGSCLCQVNSNDNIPEKDQLLSDQKVQEDDKLRLKAFQFQDKVIQLIEFDRLDEAIKYSHLMVNELESTFALFWSIRYLPEIYSTLSELYQTIHQSKKAIKYKKRSYQLNYLLQGPKSPDTKHSKEALELLTSRSKTK